MKKLVITLILVFSAFIAQAQIYNYKATEFAYKEQYRNWSKWEKVNINVVVNFNSDVVTIYSEYLQVYRVTEYVKRYRDNSGGETIEFRFIDQYYDRGTMRLRVDPYGTSQIYIDFSNITWVYNLK